MFQNLNISSYLPFKNWNVGKVENFFNTFNSTNASTVTSLSGLENWNVSNGNEFNGMFKGCQKLSSIEILNNWDIPKEKLKYIK